MKGSLFTSKPSFVEKPANRENESFYLGKKYGTNSFSTGDVFINVIAKATQRIFIA
jgi:hypothetical protein